MIRRSPLRRSARIAIATLAVLALLVPGRAGAQQAKSLTHK